MPFTVISILIFAVVVAIVYWIWTLLPLPQPAKNIVLILFAHCVNDLAGGARGRRCMVCS